MFKLQFLQFLFIIFINISLRVKSDSEFYKTWIIRTDLNLTETIKLAQKHNFKFITSIRSADNIYHLIESNHNISNRITLKRNSFQTLSELIKQDENKILAHPNVTLFKREKILTRSKRDYIDIPLSDYQSKKNDRMTRIEPKKNIQEKNFGKYILQDPMWPNLWFLNRHMYNSQLTDMNITSAWIQGYTGKGVSVTFLDDGLEWDHPDIKQNYDPEASYDFNDHDYDPMPRYDITNENKHGTRCAGEVAAAANNSFCSIGIAYNAGVGGIRMLDGPITDSLEAMSLSYNRNHVDIYSASWGPTDDGESLDGPDPLAIQALEDGTKFGRKGLGSIFVWASGNGGIYGDSCACDGYVNSIYTISISSTTDQETKPWYAEECTAILATVYSSGDSARGQHSIATTDLHYKCTTAHTATSAAAPIAAGIIALTLEANPNLTWRDIMFLIVLTSRPKVISSNIYFENKRGFLASSRYGFGLMDAGRMVELAKTWVNVPPFKSCHTDNSDIFDDAMKNINRTSLNLFTKACKNTPNEVNYIEQVEIIVTIRTPVRGKMELYLTSPMGSRTHILPKRPKDNSNRGFNQWKFKNVQLWGEIPQGNWKLEVTNFDGIIFMIEKFELIIYGTKEKPSVYL